MSNTVYVTKTSSFFPNNPVSNEEMEEFLGKVKGMRSRAKSLILRNNGIKNRYYAIDKSGKSTHTNVDMAVESIRMLEDDNFSINDIELLTCGTASPDYLMPSHASMVHGKLKIPAIDAMSASGSCNSAMWALNYAWMSLLIGKYSNAVCCGSERMSAWMQARNFEEEAKFLEVLGENPYIAFEKEFLRWMLSDGAASLLLQNKPNPDGLSLKIDFIEIKSYANLVETCMFAGGIKKDDGEVVPWRSYEPCEWLNMSVFSLKQDARLLEKHITQLGAQFLRELSVKYKFTKEDIDLFLPHMSSEFFRSKIKDDLNKIDFDIPDERWFTNLHSKGNVAAASGFIMLDEIFNSGRLKKGQKLLLMIPESARFSYTFAMFSVV